MTLLEEFVFSLSKAERDKLRPLQFRGPKRTIFFKVLDCKSRSGIDSEAIIKRHKLTKKRYYQMLSDILSDCYKDIEPGDGTKLLFFLGNKQLFRHLYNEMRKQEAALIEKQDQEALATYYFQVLIHRNLFLLHREFNADLANELDSYAYKYVAVKKPHPHDRLYLRTIEINKETEKPLEGINIETINSTIAELEDIFKQVKAGNHILAQFTTNDTLFIFSSNYHPEGKGTVEHARYGIRMLDKHEAIFGSLKVLYRLEYLQHLTPQEGNTIENMKRQLLELSKLTGCSFYHLGKFFSGLIRAGEHEWVKKFIHKSFTYNVALLRNDIVLHYWYTLTILHIYSGEYPEGHSCLRQAFLANMGKNRNINSDIHLRCYEVFFVAMQGDPLALEQAVTRQIRYFQRHGYKRSATYHSIFLKAVDNLIKCIGFNDEKALTIYHQFLKTPGIERFSALFKKIFQKYFKALAPN